MYFISLGLWTLLYLRNISESNENLSTSFYYERYGKVTILQLMN